jgi:hypothetical protein
MNIDLEQMSAELAEISADSLLNKDLSIHKEKIASNIAKVEMYLSEHEIERSRPLNQEILKMGYWFYEYRNLSDSQ